MASLPRAPKPATRTFPVKKPTKLADRSPQIEKTPAAETDVVSAAEANFCEGFDVS
jgi:hypothetical protein